ncbi:MAG: DNA polymerase III subunit gamma/tau [Verrucomicrobiota bacterium]|nr:DNA polymerase III subunit gamma/tau [Verrucomicrobiota bacterium]
MENGYQVIARRWRPKQFGELVGQDHIVRTLSNAIESNRIAHAYLFVGPRGTGKTSSARLFAKCLNAAGGPSIIPDNDSDISQSIMNGSCMDVIEIDGASNNSVDQVRDLRDDCQYAPAQCTFKIYIIDEVHMLSTAAFNALLKTLEEPPSHVKFIFATTESHKVLPTIVSRCQRFEFRPISNNVIVEKLKMISESEGIIVESAALDSIARLANGGMRDSQSILDQMISFCGDTIREQDVLDVYGLISTDRINELASFLGALDFKSIIASVDQYASEGRDLYRILQDLIAYLRTVLLDSIEKNGQTNLLGTMHTNESIMRMLDALQRGEQSVQKGLSETVNFEVVLLKAAEESRARAIDTVIKQLVGTGLFEGNSSATSNTQKKKVATRTGDLTPMVIPDPSRKDSRFVSIASSRILGEVVDQTVNTSTDVFEVSLEADESPIEASLLAEDEFKDLGEVADQDFGSLVLRESTELITIEQANSRLSDAILASLLKNFNGKVDRVRNIDGKDRIF